MIIIGECGKAIVNGVEVSFDGYNIMYKPKGGGKMNYRSLIAHTRMRFDTMTVLQLWTRMGKITTPEKLLAFAEVAKERGHLDLSIAAEARYAVITGKNINTINKSPKINKKQDPNVRLLRRLDQ